MFTYLFNQINEDCLGFSFDGSGDFSTVEIYKLGEEIKLLEKINYPNSLGIFYQAFTQFLGLKIMVTNTRLWVWLPMVNQYIKKELKKF